VTHTRISEGDANGEIAAITETETMSLATHAYNNLGQRTSTVRGNGVITR
jgi:hypothetical protein